MEELNEYYQQRERKNAELVGTWCYAVLFTALIAGVWGAVHLLREQISIAAGPAAIEARVTAYCPGACCCGKYADGVTASGHRIQPGEAFVAADRRLPFGTELRIPGYNGGRPVKVLDRGGAIKGDRFDVFFPTHRQALQWGVKYLTVSVVNRK